MPGTSRLVFAVAALVAALPSVTLPAQAQTRQEIDWCARGDPDSRIYGCTALIQSGGYEGELLARIFASRGQGYHRKRQFERAIQDFDQAIRIYPQLAEAYNSRCYSTAKLNKELQRALSDCNIALRLKPNDAYALGSRGLVYKLMGEYDRAIEDLNRSISLNSSLAEVFYDRGHTYVFKREFERAIADFDQTIYRDPNFANAYLLRGYAYRSLGRLDQALADLRRAFVFFPNSKAVADHVQLVQQEVAKEAAERATKPAATGSGFVISSPAPVPAGPFDKRWERVMEGSVPIRPTLLTPRYEGDKLSSGYILTNHHVVDGCVKVRIRSPIGSVEATVTATDKANDLALLSAEVRDRTALVFRDGPGIRPADPIVAIGFPYSGLLATSPIVSTGTVSALAGLMDDSRFLQISAPIQPGNSGGPLLDNSGNVVGVIVSTISASTIMKYTGSIPQNINFAIKANEARQFLDVKRIAYATATSEAKLDPADVGEKGSRSMVLVECYK